LMLADSALLRYTGLLLAHRRSALGLATLLRDFLGCDVAVEQFSGAWCPIAERERSRLGRGTESERLGFGAVADATVWYPQASFVLSVGPISLRRKMSACAGAGRPRRPESPMEPLFRELLPNTRLFGEALELARHFTQGQFSEIR